MIGFVSPSQFGHSNLLGYAVLILTGVLAIGIFPPLLWTGSASRGGRQAAVSYPGEVATRRACLLAPAPALNQAGRRQN